MSALEKALRNELNATIVKAREISENAARKALSGLAVGDNKPYDYMTEEQKAFRRILRAHGRELGDARNADGTQDTALLIEECAYEHWNCMLFSRFLAENNLLMHPEMNVAVSLLECEDLAKDEGFANKWECAVSYASKMLPMIFKEESPALKVLFSQADMQALENLIENLDESVFHASDSIGWCYQFWQEKRKKEINESEVKIGERELSPVTQLFTEPYMVSFLLDNSIGAWYASQVLTDEDLRETASEEELRNKASIPGVPLEYLRFEKTESAVWQIASEGFEKWPTNLSEFKLLDPCCGSGHFLVAAFNMLVPIRMKLENIDAIEASKRVIEENINGLELDGRCVELAVFALAFAAWTFPESEGWRELPEIKIACCGKSIHMTKNEWMGLVKKKTDDVNISFVLEMLYDAFNQAPVLGSLIDPSSISHQMGIFCSWEDVWAIFKEMAVDADDENREAGISASGIISAAELLSTEYHLVVTNPPYLGTGKLASFTRKYVSEYFSDSESNLATVFIERCLQLASENGFCSMVVPNQFLFTVRYKKLRKKLLEYNALVHIVDLGAHAFEQISGEIVKVVLLGLAKDKHTNKDSYFALSCSEGFSYEDKHLYIKNESVNVVDYTKCLEDISYILHVDNAANNFAALSDYVDYSGGCSSFDAPQYYFYFWEFDTKKDGYIYSQTAPENNITASGLQYYFLWEDGEGKLSTFMAEKKRLENYSTGVWSVWSRFTNKKGLCLSMIKLLPTYYYGGGYDNNTTVFIPKNDEDLGALWCYCSSPEYNENIRKIDRSLKVTNATLVKVPFDIDHYREIAKNKYPKGLPLPFSNDPTQWIFHGHPCKSVVWDELRKETALGENRIDSSVLHIAVCRLLGFKWPAELDKSMELSNEQREIANTVADELGLFTDNDGIVCIPALGKEINAAERLINLLAHAYGESWSNNVKDQLLNCVGFSGHTLEEYLRNGFFKDHCKMFGNRPFIWQIWDGLNDGFSVLVNYHKLDNKLLSKLIYTVLGDWIQLQKDNLAAGIEGSQRRLDAANSLQRKLISILEGEAPYDIFVRWKSLKEQSIGWNPDLNDGVRLNIRPFVEAGVFRDKFNINWKKDRGRDVASSHWFNEFDGERINDKHLSLAEKSKLNS